MIKPAPDPAVFLAIVKYGSLAAAARALDVTPSAVTQRLQALEAALGVRLLDRGTRKMRLTDEGELFHVEAARLARDYDELIDTLQSRRSLVRGQVVWRAEGRCLFQIDGRGAQPALVGGDPVANL